jgi:restriction system protein
MLMYEIEIRHDGLNKYRVVKGNNSYVVEQKAEMHKEHGMKCGKRNNNKSNNKKP